MASPVVVFPLGCEDEAVSVKLAFPEDVDVLVCAVGDGLQVVGLTAHFDCALVFDGGLGVVTHGVLLGLGTHHS